MLSNPGPEADAVFVKFIGQLLALLPLREDYEENST